MSNEIDQVLEINQSPAGPIQQHAEPQRVGVSFKGTPLPLFGRTLVVGIAQYLILPTPWAAAWFYRWIIEHLSLTDETKVSFRGRGGDVWWAFMLVGVMSYAGFVPVPFLSLLLFPVMVLLWIVILRWFVRSISLSCGTQLTFSGTYWQYLGWSLLIGVSVYTIIGWAWATAGMVRWFCRNVQGRNIRVEFTGSGGQILWRTLVTILACLVVVPIPWVSLWLLRWYVSNIWIHRG